MARIRSLALRGLLLATSAFACTTSESTPETPARPIDETIEIAPRQPPTTQVLEAGAEPRRGLRLHPAAGTEEQLQMSVDMRIAMRQAGAAPPQVSIPTTVTRMRSKIEGADNGVFSVAQSVESVELIPKPDTPAIVMQQMHAAVDPLVHYRATVRSDDRGAILGGTVVVPGDLPAMVKPQMQQLAQNMGQLAVPLPSEPIGPGARWTATTDLDQNGMKLHQVGAYTLRSLDGERAVIDATITQTLAESEISVPGMFGMTAKVDEFRSEGTSVIQLDLDRLMPHDVTMNMDLHFAMDMTVLGQAQHVEMDMGFATKMVRIGD